MAKNNGKGLVRWEKFGRGVRVQRKKREVGLRAFAASSCIDKATLCRAEAGKVLSVESYFALCLALDLDPWDYINQR